MKQAAEAAATKNVVETLRNGVPTLLDYSKETLGQVVATGSDDKIQVSLSEINMTKASKNALELEDKRLHIYEKLTSENEAIKGSYNQGKRKIGQNFNRLIKTISATVENVRTKADELVSIINSSEYPWWSSTVKILRRTTDLFFPVVVSLFASPPRILLRCMRRSFESKLEPFDPEIERTARRRRQQQRLKEQMERHEQEQEEERQNERRIEMPRRTLPSNTETNPREHVKAVELRSGKALESKEKKNKQALKKAKLDAQFGKFLEIFKKLHINIPFADALLNMPSYAKFLKDILANKRKLEDHMTVNLTENCSALVQNRMPPKQKDPGSFSIPCIIGDINFHKALCDLGASINLMPYSVFRRLGLGEPKPTRMSLQLADRSVKYPRGIIEDVLVKVDKFIFPADFVVLDMEEDLEMPLILGRPFLATGKALIDVDEGKLRLRVGEEEIIFDVFNTLKHTMHDDSCFRVDVLDSLVCDFVQDGLQEPLEATLTTEKQEDELDEERMEMVAHLNAIPLWRKQVRLRLEELGDRKDLMPQKSSLEEPPTLELKPLPPHLKYVYLGENNKMPVIISSSLTDDMESKLLGVLKEHRGAFAWKVSDIKGISPSICMHKILMEDKYSPLAQPQRRLNPKMQEVVKGGITVITNEKNELIPTRIVTGWRVCMDYRKLNDATRKDHFPLPFIDQMIERLAGHEFYCFLDGYSGYNQITIAPEDQEKTTFTCPYGTFAFRRMPFGLCNAPATFQRCMAAIFHDMIENFLEVFMDDFSIFGSSFDECLKNLNLVLIRCEESNLVLNWEKCHFMVQEGIVLGHKVSENGIEVDKAKVEVIKNLPPPSSIKGVRSFLGHAGFYRRFIKDFSKIAKPLSSLLMKDVEFNFDSTCLQAFEVLKKSLVTAPVLTAPDWELPFEVMCDASDTAVGAVLGQRKNKVFHTIYYASKTLNDAQLNYATTEKELLAIVFAFEKFHSYLVLSKVIVYTDHSTLKYLLAKKDAKPRLIRWILLLQEFDLEIRDKKGVENVVADHLSRLEDIRINGVNTDIDDWFPDEQLFEVNACPWYANFSNFLVTGTPPPNLSFHQRKKFFSDVYLRISIVSKPKPRFFRADLHSPATTHAAAVASPPPPPPPLQVPAPPSTPGFFVHSYHTMAPKRSKVTHGASSSRSTPSIFVNDRARERFEHAKLHRKPIPERGCTSWILDNIFEELAVAGRGWTNFLAQPNAAVVPVVREFYANAPEGTENKAKVRGRLVPYDPTTINDLLGLPAVDDSVFQAWVLNPDYDLIIHTLCYPGTTWKQPGTYTVFLEKFLKVEAALWYAFLSKRLMPVGHTSDVQRDRAVVLYAIYTGMPIYVGKLIFGQLNICINCNNLAFYFPTIVTELCARAGVIFADDDEWLPPLRAIDEALHTSKYAKRRDELPADVFYGLVQAAPPPPVFGHPPPPQPRRRAIRDRVDELGAWATYQTHYQAIDQAHTLNIEYLVQGISTHLGLDTSGRPPVPAYPPPFHFQYTYPMPPAADEGNPPPEHDEEEEF
ncbi:uncharacterized protein [Primulina eburnea]|uniref:uncharacterized protein n=1 Tax=Primulina eburnea TaxID=1245227 RepID=UPI003C6CAEE0